MQNYPYPGRWAQTDEHKVWKAHSDKATESLSVTKDDDRLSGEKGCHCGCECFQEPTCVSDKRARATAAPIIGGVFDGVNGESAFCQVFDSVYACDCLAGECCCAGVDKVDRRRLHVQNPLSIGGEMQNERGFMATHTIPSATRPRYGPLNSGPFASED